MNIFYNGDFVRSRAFSTYGLGKIIEHTIDEKTNEIIPEYYTVWFENDKLIEQIHQDSLDLIEACGDDE